MTNEVVKARRKCQEMYWERETAEKSKITQGVNSKKKSSKIQRTAYKGCPLLCFINSS